MKKSKEVTPSVPKRKRENSKGYKSLNRFGLLTLVIAAMVVILVFFLFYHYEKKTGVKQLMKDGSALCSLITDAARQELFLENGNRNLNLIDYVVREKELVYCLIIDDNFTPLLQLGRYVPEQNSQIVRNSWKTNYLLTQKYRENTNNEIMYEFSKPIYLQDSKVGLVRVGLSLSNYIHFTRSFSCLMGVITFSIFALVLIFYYLLKKILVPLSKLNQDITQMIIQKQEFPKIEISFNGDVGLLAQKVNKLFGMQQEKNQKLERINTDVEVANKILHYEKSRMRTILDNLKVGLIFIDSTGKAIFANQLAGHFLKVDKKEYLNKSWERFLGGQSPELVQLFHEFGQKGNIYSHEFLEVEIQNADFPIILRHDCFYLLNKEDKPLGFLWTITDITNQKQAELSRYELVNHVVHELKTPLDTLGSYTEMFIDGKIEGQDKTEFVNNINEEIIRLSRLINNLLNLSNIEMGSFKINPTLTKVDKLIEDCYQKVRPQAINKGIDFHYDVADKMPNLLLDKDLIESAILNFLTNAIKYTPQAGKVIMEGLVEEDHILVKVSDTGYGISESEMNHIFDKFFQSSRKEIKKESGVGLGLALAKNIIQLHKGDIKVESKEGNGSTFTLIFPIEEVYI